MREFRVRDPIHGFIRLSPVELEIINSRPFQRLRNIKQLSMTYLAYPGAEHSRFGHSLGVAAFSAKVFDQLVRKHGDIIQSELKWSSADIKRNRQLICLSSLLHDIGHPPFSHATEDFFPSDYNHEDYTRRIILESEISDIIDRHKNNTGVSADDVARFFSLEGKLDSTNALLRQIFSSEVDSDKMDYLLRDSLYAGVSYGKYDHERLINSLCLIQAEDGNYILAIEEGGMHALEALVLARYFMFTQVYFHKVARVYHLHLSQALSVLKLEYPDIIKDFLLWDDIKMMTFLRENEEEKHTNIVLNRQHYKLAYHSREDTDKEEYKKNQRLEQAVKNRFDPSILLCDYASKASHKFQKDDFYVHCDDNKYILINVHSEIIKQLVSIDQFRVYCDKSMRNEVANFCEDFD